MGSALNLATANKKPEIIANVPKVTFEDKKESDSNDKEAEKEKSQPNKRRSEYILQQFHNSHSRAMNVQVNST
jgi:hypothetical protein